MKNIEDDLIIYKQQKHFLDILAIQEQKKKYRPKHHLNEQSQLGLGDYDSQNKATFINKQKDNTFMTGVNASPTKLSS